MTTRGKDGGSRRTHAARALLPSLIVLGAVFFFINSACLQSGDDDDPCSYTPNTPAGAAIGFVAPDDAQAFSVRDASGAAKVPVQLRASGVSIEPAHACHPGGGHFTLLATPAERPCAAVFADLDDGSSGTTLALTPGSYTIEATFENAVGQPFYPALTATVHVTVTGLPGQRPPGACPSSN